MKRHPIILASVLLSLTIISSAAPAQRTASGIKYDSNCRPLSEERKALLSENVLLNAIAPVWNAPCRAEEFVKNLVKKKDFDPDKIDADDVFNAAKPNVTARSNPYGIPEGVSDEEFKRRFAQAKYRAENPNWRADQELTRRRQTNAANDDTRSFDQMLADDRQLRGDPIVLPPTTPNGSPVVFQPDTPGGPVPSSVAEINGGGVLLSADGMKKGTFKQGKLNGVGEEIDPNGTWRGGTFQNGTNMGYVYEVRTVDGKTYIAAGSMVNGKLDGMIERVYADGSTQFEDWEGGQLMQVGLRAPKGRAALAPQARYKPPVEVATTDLYKKIGPRPKIAPGTTFDPARTTQKSFDGKWENTEPQYPGNTAPAYAVRQITIVTRPDGLYVTTEGGDFSGLFVLTNVFEGSKRYQHVFAAPSGGFNITHYIEAYDGYTVFRFQDGSYGANFRRWRTPAQHVADRGRAEQIWQACQGKARALVTFMPLRGATEASFQTQIEAEHQKVLNSYDRRLTMSERQTYLQDVQAQYPAKQARFQSYPQDYSAGRDFLLFDQWLCYAQQEMALTK